MNKNNRNERFECIEKEGHAPIKSWTKDVPFEEAAKCQLENMAKLPFIHDCIAVMPDVHVGKGSTIGSVIPTIGAIIPAAVGVDIGCGMMAAKTSLKASDLPDNLEAIRSNIESKVPIGRAMSRSNRDPGSWTNPPQAVLDRWLGLSSEFKKLCDKYPFLEKTNHVTHLGTLGTGNHFIEVCIDENQDVWVMLHSGSRGVGNAIGNHFIAVAKKEMEKHHIHLPDQDLAYITEGSTLFDDYVQSVAWAQDFAKVNRSIMMVRTLEAIQEIIPKPFRADVEAVNCHHNYINKETHRGKDVWITRKGAVRARKGELGIIPGSMGAKSFIVRGLGNEESFCSCSHGAGRVMSRTEAKKLVTIDEHIKDTAGVACRKDKSVIDESPRAYKSIDKVMEAQKDLVEILHTLKQVVCVKG
jgi:tRNA-splicing ligase RtcB